MRSAVAVTLCAGLMACATDGASPTPPAPASAPIAVRLAQQGFGEQAHFAYCLWPECPQVTPKTLPGAPDITNASGERATGTARETTPAAPPGHASPPPDAAAASSMAVHATVGFAASDQSALGSDAMRRLDELLAALAASPRVAVSDHTDNTGSQHVNDRIALSRARAVAAYLRTRAALPPERLEVSARGRCCYVASNATPEGRARNRRVEIATHTGHAF